MLLNESAETLMPHDMTSSAEFVSLLQSAADLGISHEPEIRYASRNTVVRGQRFHFLEWGEPDAPTILLLHGGNQSAHSWDLVSLHLASRYHVLALDQRGHGDSEWSRDLDYSPEAMAADALAFLEDQGVERPIIMGHSMGGNVTLHLSVARPDLARGVVIVDVGPEMSPKGVAVIQNFVTHNVEFDDLEEFLDRVAEYDRFRPREHIARTVKYNMLRRVDGKYVSKVDHRRAAPSERPRLSMDELAALPYPLLLVRGAESDVLEADAAERFVAGLQHGKLVTVPRAGHNVHGANTQGFIEAVDPFLADLVSGSSGTMAQTKA